jgi:hypothetical protein
MRRGALLTAPWGSPRPPYFKGSKSASLDTRPSVVAASRSLYTELNALLLARYRDVRKRRFAGAHSPSNLPSVTSTRLTEYQIGVGWDPVRQQLNVVHENACAGTAANVARMQEHDKPQRLRHE